MTEPAAGPGMRETVLTIEGMTCAACAARVQKKLNGLQGASAAVNYATATARVTAPAGLPAGELVAAVEQAGYAARELARRPAGRGRHGRTGRRAGGRLPASAGCSSRWCSSSRSPTSR